MSATKYTRQPLPPITDDEQDYLAAQLRLANWIWHAVNGTPLSEQTVPEPLPCSRCLRLVKADVPEAV